MQIIREPEGASTIADPELRQLVEKTIADLSEDHPYDPAELGFFLIVQPGDSLETINAQIGFDILCNRWTGIRYDQPKYAQSFEYLDEFAGWYEMLFIISDDGYGIQVYIEKVAGVPVELLAMCQRFAVPAPTAAGTI
jgi:hypothetical protein